MCHVPVCFRRHGHVLPLSPGQRIADTGMPSVLWNAIFEPPVLLLRAFRDDVLELGDFTEGGSKGCNPVGIFFFQGVARTFEEFLYEKLSLDGPVLAIGRPGQMVAPLGAGRFWVDNGTWTKVVDQLLKESRYVVMIMGKLPPLPLGKPDGLNWEVERLFSMRECQKVIFVMPPVSESEVAVRWQLYHQRSNGRLPPYQGGETAATFKRDGTCQVVRVEPTGRIHKSYPRDRRAYELALVGAY